MSVNRSYQRKELIKCVEKRLVKNFQFKEIIMLKLLIVIMIMKFTVNIYGEFYPAA